MKNPIVNALLALAYIVGIVYLINHIAGGADPDTILMPIMMLSLLTLSAAVMAFLFLKQPVELLIDGKKQEAVTVFFKTIGVFALITFVVYLLLLRWMMTHSKTVEVKDGAPVSYDQNISDDRIKIEYPSDEFGLAVKSVQLPPSYIPACDRGVSDATFGYCIYYKGTEYTGSTLESAGLSIRTRKDLTPTTCISDPVRNISGPLTPKVNATSEYTAATYGGVGDAALGHYASGKVYRLLTDSTCYEIKTQVGRSRFENYPEGAIKNFTDDDEAKMFTRLEKVLSTLTLNSGTRVTLPLP